MKSIKLITLLLLIAFAFSAFTACDLIMGGTDKPGDQVTENPDDKPGDTPGGDSGNVPDECKHEWLDGICQICKIACEHVFNGDACEICGTVKSDKPDECKHEWLEGKCQKCGEPCSHEWLIGVCQKCKAVCEHVFNGDTCEICGYTEPVCCEHEWADGVCTECGEVCDHHMVNGKCTVCSMPCSHEWVNGMCSACGMSCEHKWSDSLCENCGTACAHYGWTDGKCTECGKVCDHDWMEGVCNDCGISCSHSFDGATCTNCGYTSGGIDNPITVKYDGTDYYVPYSATFFDFVCLHVGMDYYETIINGYWAIVIDGEPLRIEDEYVGLCEYGREISVIYVSEGGNTPPESCPHIWDDGICIECGKECAHEWSGEVCINCSKICRHFFQNGVCNTCNTLCTHDWVEGVCNECGLNCSHEWMGGRCTICYQECKHFYADGVCKVCNMTCPHSYMDGICIECGKECAHEWSAEECLICGKICSHFFQNGACVSCGAQCNHAWIPEGFCEICGMECVHVYDGITCTICGATQSGALLRVVYDGMSYDIRYESTLGDFLIEHLYMSYEDTVANGGHWEALDPFTGNVTIFADTSLSNFGAYVEIFFMVGSVNPPDECDHYWSDGVCMYCYKACEHVFSGDTCEICGYIQYYEYVSINVTFFYWTYPEDLNPDLWDGASMEMQIYYDKLLLYAGYERNNTLASFIYEYNNWNPNLSQYAFNWFCNGESISVDTLLSDNCQLIAVDQSRPEGIRPIVRFRVPLMGIEHAYLYECPVLISEVCARFEEEFGIDKDLYYIDSIEGGYDGLALNEVTVYYRMEERTLSVYHVTETYTNLLAEQRYFAIEYPTYATLLSDAGVNPSYYVVVDGLGDLIDLECEAWGSVYIIDRSIVESEYMITVSFKEYDYSDPLVGTLNMNSVTSLVGLIGIEIVAEDGSYFSIPDLYGYTFTVNGKEYNYFDTKNDRCFIYTDTMIEIKPCYSVRVEYYDVNTKEYVTDVFTFEYEPSGGDVLARLDINPSFYTVNYNWRSMSHEEFNGCIVSNESYVTLTPNKVKVYVTVTDSYGMATEHPNESDYSLDLKFITNEFGSDYEMMLIYPDGTVKELSEGESLVVYYDPSSYEGDNSYRYTVYKVECIALSFNIYVSIDGMGQQEITVNRNDGLTIGQIVEDNCQISFDDYEWIATVDGCGIEITRDYVPNGPMNLDGYDNRPHLTVRIGSESYKIHHTAALTLGEAIAAINEKYGTEFSYGSCEWYIYNNSHMRNELITDPSRIVINAGEINDISGKVITRVNVYYYNDFGTIFTEDGDPCYTFERGDEWKTPPIEEWVYEMLQGFYIYTGEYEYRVYDESYNVIDTIEITSVDDLFNLGRSEVELYAKKEKNTERIVGTYFSDSYIFEVSEDTISYLDPLADEVYSNVSYRIEITGMVELVVDLNGYETRLPGGYLSESNRLAEDSLLIAYFDMDGRFDTLCTSIDDFNSKFPSDWYAERIITLDGKEVGEIGEVGVYIVYPGIMYE